MTLRLRQLAGGAVAEVRAIAEVPVDTDDGAKIRLAELVVARR